MIKNRRKCTPNRRIQIKYRWINIENRFRILPVTMMSVWTISNKNSRKTLKNHRKWQKPPNSAKIPREQFESGFSAFLVPQNPMIATKILTLSAIGKKLPKLRRPYWIFANITKPPTVPRGIDLTRYSIDLGEQESAITPWGSSF